MFTNKLSELKKRSEKAINIFQSTIDSLSKTNEEIFLERLSKIEQIKALQAESQALLGLENTNTKVIDKIQEFLKE